MTPVLVSFLAFISTAANPPPAPGGARQAPGGVQFELAAPDATRVFLAADFNDWAENRAGRVTHPEFALERGPDKIWRKTFPIDTDVVTYQFVIEDAAGNSRWLPDPRARLRDRNNNSVRILTREILDTGPAQLAINRDEGRVTLVVIDTDGRVVSSTQIGPVYLDVRPFIDVKQLSSRAIEVKLTPRKPATRLVLPIHDNSNYYGTGERFHALNQKGYIVPIASIDRPEPKGTASYKPIPFFMSTRGYGLWLDTAEPATFDFNATERSRVLLTVDASKLRFVLFAGPSFIDILREFTALTGRPPVPPAWSFAPWKSRDVHRNRDEVLQDAELTRKHDLPGSVIVIDSPWETGYNDFNINQQQFPDPASMFARLESLGFYTCLWLTPFVNTRNKMDMPGIEPGPTSTLTDAAAKGLLVKQPDGQPYLASWWKGKGGLVDFTNPAAVAWWHEQLARTAQFNIRAFKCDDGEGNFIADARFHDGSPASAMKNRYAVEYLRATYSYLTDRFHGDGVLFARCGFTGSQKYPFCWCGDLETNFSTDNGLPAAIIAGQSAALSGLSMWGHDIAGYIGEPTPECFIRWTQFGCFSPLMQIHMTCNKGPWDFGPEALDIYRTFAKLHTQLYPYINAAAHEAATTGMPIIRPMVFAFQSDPAAAAHIYQYMFGPDLLVAPMYAGGTRRTVYLPKGDWLNYWTGSKDTGPRTIDVEAPIAQVPLFVRAGAIIEMLPPDINTLITKNDKLDKSAIPLDDRRIVQVWPGPSTKLDSPDGLQISTAENEIILESATPRPIELQFMHTRFAKTAAPSIPDAKFRHDETLHKTICTIPSLAGRHTLRLESSP